MKLRRALLEWFSEQQRDLPWRKTSDPYAVWISEIMLQQTRVAAVIPFYERFLARFPDFRSLATATESDLLAHWSGLGYYYRARNLQKAALTMLANGHFPSTYEAIRELPGVGDYTAAAIGSISFDLPHAVVDGNVFRVLSRLFADSTNIASPAGKRHFSELANDLLDREQPGMFNQALMEVGATVCLPKNPQCLLCPVGVWCKARESRNQESFPVKIVNRKSVQEHRTVFWIENQSRILAWKRPQTARLMPGFWELPEIQQIPNVTPLQKLGSFRHGITFHDFRFEVWTAEVPSRFDGCEWMDLSALARLPVSTIFKKAARVAARATVRCATASS